MKNEFRDFAVKHMGLNGLAVDDYMNITSSYISPTIIEERQLNVAHQHDDNAIKEFSEPEMVATIKIGERTFLPTKDGATEVLQKDPPIFVQYRGSLKWEGKRVGYGGRSETSAVETYSTFQSGSTTHKLETEKLILTRIDKIFRIERKGKQYRFINEKQFLKAFPDQKEKLKKYADDNKIDFNDIENVLQIYNYASTL